MTVFRFSLRVMVPFLLAFGAPTFLAGCGGNGADDDGGASAADVSGTAPSSDLTSDLTLPEGLFLTAAPSGAVSLSEAKSTASVGDEVILKAKIGGRVEPFAEQAATFLVADRSMPTCLDRHGDEGCPTPWDYCCEPRESLLASLATVQLVDGAGRPLRMSLNGRNGLAPMKDIIVVGTVSQSDGPAFVINADGIYLEQS